MHNRAVDPRPALVVSLHRAQTGESAPTPRQDSEELKLFPGAGLETVTNIHHLRCSGECLRGVAGRPQGALDRRRNGPHSPRVHGRSEDLGRTTGSWKRGRSGDPAPGRLLPGNLRTRPGRRCLARGCALPARHVCRGLGRAVSEVAPVYTFGSPPGGTWSSPSLLG